MTVGITRANLILLDLEFDTRTVVVSSIEIFPFVNLLDFC